MSIKFTFTEYRSPSHLTQDHSSVPNQKLKTIKPDKSFQAPQLPSDFFSLNTNQGLVKHRIKDLTSFNPYSFDYKSLGTSCPPPPKQSSTSHFKSISSIDLTSTKDIWKETRNKELREMDRMFNLLNYSPFTTRSISYSPQEKFVLSQMHQAPYARSANSHREWQIKTPGILNNANTINSLIIDFSKLNTNFHKSSDFIPRDRLIIAGVKAPFSDTKKFIILCSSAHSDYNVVHKDKTQYLDTAKPSETTLASRINRIDIKSVLGGISLASSEFYMGIVRQMAEVGSLLPGDEIALNPEIQRAMHRSIDSVHDKWNQGLVSAINFDPKSDQALVSKKTADWGLYILDYARGNFKGIGKFSFASKELEPLKYTRSNLRLGQQIHKSYRAGEVILNAKTKEYVLPSKKRIDFLDEINGIVYELKPNNPRAIREGNKQLQRYIDELKTIPDFKKINWVGILDTY